MANILERIPLDRKRTRVGIFPYSNVVKDLYILRSSANTDKEDILISVRGLQYDEAVGGIKIIILF